MIGYIGADVVYEAPRGTFGFLELYDKVPLIPALVGLFAIFRGLRGSSSAGVVLSESDDGIKVAPGWSGYS